MTFPTAPAGVGVEVVDPDAEGPAVVSNFLVLANELAVGANNLELVIELVLDCPFMPILPTPPALAPAFEAVESRIPIDDTPAALLVVLPRAEILLPPTEFNLTLDALLLPAVPGLLNVDGIGDLALELELAIEAFCS